MVAMKRRGQKNGSWFQGPRMSRSRDELDSFQVPVHKKQLDMALQFCTRASRNLSSVFAKSISSTSKSHSPCHRPTSFASWKCSATIPAGQQRRMYITFRSHLNLSSFVLQVGQPALRLNHLHWIQQKSKQCDVLSKGLSSWRRAMCKRPKSCTSEAQKLNATLAHFLISA